MEQGEAVHQWHVTILHADGEEVIGNGILVSPSLVLTCSHVIESARNNLERITSSSKSLVLMRFPFSNDSGLRWAEEISTISIDSSGWHDVSILRLVDEAPQDSSPAKLVNLPQTKNLRFNCYGFPAGYEDGVYSYGIVRDITAGGLLQLEGNAPAGLPIHPGFSGAALIAARENAVVGIVTSSADYRMAFAVPMSLLARYEPEILGNVMISPEAEYRKRISEHLLRGDWLERFIHLSLMPLTVTHSHAEDVNDLRKRHTIFQIAERYRNTPIALLGEPGAGKTTLAKRLALNYAESGYMLPVFLETTHYMGQGFQKWIEDYLQTDFLPDFASGKYLVVLDGLNELGRDYEMAMFLREFVSFVDRFPLNQYIVTSRTAAYPAYLRQPTRNNQLTFVELEVQKLLPEEVREYFRTALPEVGDRLFDATPQQIRELCGNPLLLTMFAYLYEPDQIRVPAAFPRNRPELYSMFLDMMYAREETISTTLLLQGDLEEVLREIASRMNNEVVSVGLDKLGSWLRNLRGFAEHRGIGPSDLLKQLVASPPLRVSKPGKSKGVQVSFMHQSFQEYFTALNVLERYDTANAMFDNMRKYLHPKSEHWWETLVLAAGMLEDATEFIRAAKLEAESLAFSERIQRTFVLVARLINEALHVAPLEVDDFIVRVLRAFKFGWVSADYDLILALTLVRSDQKSSTFPQRLSSDVEWFREKYVRVEPVKLDQNLEAKDLVDFLHRNHATLAIDALYTLRYHPQRHTVVSGLLSYFEDSVQSAIVREQTIAALGFAAEGITRESHGPLVDRLVNMLTEIVDGGSSEDTEWCRLYALNALGRLGQAGAVPTLVNYLLNHDNPYRDSASWALQDIAVNNLEDVMLRESLKELYFEALLNETDDIYGRYAKGNIVYSLGELGATEFVEGIVRWLETQTEPYVLEDGVQALGQLGSVRAIPELLRYVDHEDPVVRMFALEAIWKIERAGATNDMPGKLGTVKIAESFLDREDELPIVKEYATRVVSGLA